MTVKIKKQNKSKAEKIKSEAEDLRTKYPEIAKMTVAEVVNTDDFTSQLIDAIAHLGRINFYIAQSLKRSGLLETETFKKEYITCLDKESKLSSTKRAAILYVGNNAYQRTVRLMMRKHDKLN